MMERLIPRAESNYGSNASQVAQTNVLPVIKSD